LGRSLPAHRLGRAEAAGNAFRDRWRGRRSHNGNDLRALYQRAYKREDLSRDLDRPTRDASAVVLRGYELPTDFQIVRPGERYFNDRRLAMWQTVTKLLAKRGQWEIA
jgi:hypothetical protein